MDKISELKKVTDELMEVTRENLDKAIARGEKIEVLVEKTKTMSALSLDLNTNSKVSVQHYIDSEEPDDVEEPQVENHNRTRYRVGNLFHFGGMLWWLHNEEMFLMPFVINKCLKLLTGN